MTQALGSADGVTITGPPEDRYGEILTDRALALIAQLHRTLRTRAGGSCSTPARSGSRSWPPAGVLDFLPETKDVREDPTGRWPSRRPAWSTGGSRSPARPTAR